MTKSRKPETIADGNLDTVQGAGAKGVILSSESHEPTKGVILSSETHEPAKGIVLSSESEEPTFRKR